MISVDTSIWVDHLRKPDELLVYLLSRGEVVVHPYVVGEIALGYLNNRAAMLRALTALPVATIARHPEVVEFIEQASLFGTGLGYVDVHLLASVRLMKESSLWTRDKRLAKTAETMGLSLRLN